ncbi:hypothetical protein BST79_gp148 [Only Syngen Nebraska virus 5]|uniref:hypothetical protein n=1 Tax=Only Syngen Nebraska virus 5 TaxID=1917232 RepID=UPI000901C9C0|nr:hypothetical protein BST79_gp148 [Only Syngen Nebraska virus 5]APC25661.1 hypothetical protein [Only Syngen Nebraska virus 5]
MSPDVILSAMYDELERLLEDEQSFKLRLRIIEKGNNIVKKEEYSKILSNIQRNILEITKQIQFSEIYLMDRRRLGITV